LSGWERGPTWRGFATGCAKELFLLGSRDADRICVAEAATDTMSLAAIEILRPDALYISTGGGRSPAMDEALRCIATGNVRLVAATDNRQGDICAERIQAIAAGAGARYVRCRPRGDDWNDDLKTLLARFSNDRLPPRV
jgi:hypothetical protein